MTKIPQTSWANTQLRTPTAIAPTSASNEASAAHAPKQSAATASLPPRQKKIPFLSTSRPPTLLSPSINHDNRDHTRDVTTNNWRDRAGPWFERRDYESFKQMTYGNEFRLRSDRYENDSEASDIEDLPTLEAIPSDPQMRKERFRRETLDLFRKYEDILSNARQAHFNQDSFRIDLEAERNGACLGLTMRWLQSAHDDPKVPAGERLNFLASDQEAKRVFKMQQSSDRLHDELAFRTYRPLEELSNKSEDLKKVQFEKYRTYKAVNGATPKDVGAQIALRLTHMSAASLHVLIPNPGAHAIACEKMDDGRFRLFEPNHGVYETEPKKLDELLAAILIKHIDFVTSLENKNYNQNEPLEKNLVKLEVRAVPVRIFTNDKNDMIEPQAGKKP